MAARLQRFHDVACQLQNEERNTVGSLQNLLFEAVGQRASRRFLAQLFRAIGIEPPERHSGYVGELCPARLELRPGGHNHKVPKRVDELDGELQQLERGRVDPMGVLDDHQHGAQVIELAELLDQRLQSYLLALFRRHHVDRRGLVERNGQKGGEGAQRRLIRVSGFANEPAQLGDSDCDRVVSVDRGSSLKLLDRRMKRAFLMLRRAEPADSHVPVCADVFLKGLGQTRFADPGLADQMDDLTASVSCSYPTLNKRFELALASHEG